jgi:hypothetical protein
MLQDEDLKEGRRWWNWSLCFDFCVTFVFLLFIFLTSIWYKYSPFTVRLYSNFLRTNEKRFAHTHMYVCNACHSNTATPVTIQHDFSKIKSQNINVNSINLFADRVLIPLCHFVYFRDYN